LQNQFGFDGPNLWHFQVEIESGRALPTSNYSPEEHPRVGRLRNLFAAEPDRVAAEVRDFRRAVYHARTTPDGRFTVMDGVGDGRIVRVLDHSTGKVVESWPTAYADKNSNLFLDPSGGRAVLQTTATESMTCYSVPDGRPLQHFVTPRTALNARAGYSGRGLSIPPFGCVLFQGDDETPRADLALGVPVNATAFDPAGRFLVWGGRDGSVVVCRLDPVRARLTPLGLGW
jgi:hypothetical protein